MGRRRYLHDPFILTKTFYIKTNFTRLIINEFPNGLRIKDLKLFDFYHKRNEKAEMTLDLQQMIEIFNIFLSVLRVFLSWGLSCWGVLPIGGSLCWGEASCQGAHRECPVCSVVNLGLYIISLYAHVPKLFQFICPSKMVTDIQKSITLVMNSCDPVKKLQLLLPSFKSRSARPCWVNIPILETKTDTYKFKWEKSC